MNNKCEYSCYRDTRSPVGVVTKNLSRVKLVVFDMDGVLTDTYSSWKYVHDYFQTNNDNSVNEYLKGEIDDLEFIRRDVNLWRENKRFISQSKLEEILSDIPLMYGAKKCICELKKRNVKTVIVSAGLQVLADRVGKELGIDFVFSNGLKIDTDGLFTGEGIVGVRLMYKDLNVLDVSKRLGIGLDEVVAVGNSCFDIPMFEVCGLGIAFNADDDCVKDAADFVVGGKDLGCVLDVLDSYF